MFQFSEQHIEQHRELGYTVFRGIIPPALIEDLRRQCDRGGEQARGKHGPQAQRFQPLLSYDLDLKPFEDFRDLPALRDAVAQVLTPDHTYGDFTMLGVLVEPAEEPWCTAWHRDWRDNIEALDLNRFEANYQDNDLFNQVNCALYEDSSTWVVPGSHLRRDTQGEIARFPDRPIPRPEWDGLASAARERVCLDYCESLPGAKRLLLDAGDFCLYRNVLWHLGNYVPYRKRATLHDSVVTPKFRQWINEALADVAHRREAGMSWENPNPPVSVSN